MPELAEVEHNRRRWDPGIGHRILRVVLHPTSRDFLRADTEALAAALTGAVLQGSQARGKQMLFRFSRGGWLGIHLGMTGRLRVDPAGLGAGGQAAQVARHDHLVLYQHGRALVFSDPRQFGSVRFHRGLAAPPWWSSLPPSLLSSEFSVTALAEFLRRHRRAPIKAVLLLQDRFPGIGNWMADEILWRAGVHPALPAGGIPPHETRRIHREIRAVVRTALATVGEGQRDLPRTWLIHRRWNDGERCPRTGVPLVRETIGGRTTCWSPGRQKAPRGPRRETGPRGRD